MPTEPLTASFRDPSGFLFVRDGTLYRQVNRVYQPHLDRLLESGLYRRLVDERLLIPHEDVTSSIPPSGDGCAVLEPRLVPFISYPYEWSFGQLRQAALATLSVQKLAFEHGMVLKDASAYNVQYIGSRAVFIDTLSFETYEPNKPWIAYRQFCEHFLLPLVLMKYVDPQLGKLLQSDVSGIPLQVGVQMLPRRAKWRPSLFTHLVLHARSQSRYSDSAEAPAKQPRVSPLGMRGLIDNLESTVQRLGWRRPKSEWGDYYGATNYSDAAMQSKQQLVQSFLEAIGPLAGILDLGANTGTFSTIAQEHADLVVSMDVDPVAVDRHFEVRREEDNATILPLWVDLLNPSPGLGWANAERDSIVSRAKADAALALALIHHLAISGNVPFERICELFAELTRFLVIEFVPKGDSQVQRLLRSREDIFDAYTQEFFEAAFSTRFSIEKREPISGSERTLYLMRRHDR